MKQSLKAAPTTDLHDANPEKAQRCTLPFIDFGGRKMFAGRIRTVATMMDSQLVQALFRQSGDGAVAVVDGGGSLRTALLGDINADILAKNGWAGVIINGAVRDSAPLRTVDIGIKALGVTPVRSGKTNIGATDVPVAFGEVLFVPGDCVYCDSDGILVSKNPLSVG